MTAWQKVADLQTLPVGSLTDVVIGRDLVLLVREDETTVRAFQGLCPHEFGRLSEGILEEKAGTPFIRCPRHLARFNREDGTCGPGWSLPALRRYAVRLEDGGIYLPDPLARLD